MGLKVKLSGADMRKNRLIKKENWFKLKLDGISEQVSKKAHVGAFYIFEYLGLEGEAADVRIQMMVFRNRSWPDNLIRIIEAHTGEVIDREQFTGEEGPEFDLMSLTEDGQNIVDGFIVRGQDQDGEAANEIERLRRHQPNQ